MKIVKSQQITPFGDESYAAVIITGEPMNTNVLFIGRFPNDWIVTYNIDNIIHHDHLTHMNHDIWRAVWRKYRKSQRS